MVVLLHATSADMFAAQRLHGSVQVLAWVLLALPGALLARYHKRTYPRWFRVHRGIQITAAALSFLSAGLVIVTMGVADAFGSLHGIAGLLLLCALGVQGYLGYAADKGFVAARSAVCLTFCFCGVEFFCGAVVLDFCRTLKMYRCIDVVCQIPRWCLILTAQSFCVCSRILCVCELFQHLQDWKSSIVLRNATTLACLPRALPIARQYLFLCLRRLTMTTRMMTLFS